MLSFQNKHICLAIYDRQCESLMGHLRVRISNVRYFGMMSLSLTDSTVGVLRLHAQRTVSIN